MVAPVDADPCVGVLFARARQGELGEIKRIQYGHVAKILTCFLVPSIQVAVGRAALWWLVSLRHWRRARAGKGTSGQGQGRGCKNSSRVSWPAKPKRQDQNAAVSLRRTSGHDPLTSLPPFPSALLPCLAFYKSQTPWTIYLPIAWRADCRARSIVRYLAAIVSPKHRPSLTAPRDQHCAARPPFTTRRCTS